MNNDLLNCLIKRNVPFTVYDELVKGETVQDILCNFASLIKEMQLTVTQYTAVVEGLVDWIKNEGLQEEVKKLFEEWKNNGTWDTIINEELFKELDNKIQVVDDKIGETEKRLNLKIDTGRQELDTKIDTGRQELDTNISNLGAKVEDAKNDIKSLNNDVNYIKDTELTSINNSIDSVNKELSNKANLDSVFSMNNMGEDVKEAMTGGSVAVVGVNSVVNSNIVDKQITGEKIESFKTLPISSNIVNYTYNFHKYNSNKYIDGAKSSPTFGQEKNGPSGSGLNACSEFLEVEPSKTYYYTGFTGGFNVVYYDNQKKGIASQFAESELEENTPKNCQFIRFSFNKDKTSEGFINISQCYHKNAKYSYGIDDLYTRVSPFIDFDFGFTEGEGRGFGGLEVDWDKQTLKAYNCKKVTVNFSKEVFYLLDQSEPTTFTILNFNSLPQGNEKNYLILFNTITNRFDVVFESNKELLYSNNIYVVGMLMPSNRRLYLNGFGFVNQQIDKYKAYYRSNDGGVNIVKKIEDKGLLLTLKPGRLYISDSIQQYIRHELTEETTFNIPYSEKLVYNLVDKQFYIKVLSNSFDKINKTSEITLLVNVDGKIVEGLLMNNVELSDGSKYNKDIEIDSFYKKVGSFNLDNGIYLSDHTIIDNELWQFCVSNDNHTNYTNCNIFTLSDNGLNANKTSSFTHNFGHVNTIDYNPQTNTLILGNGGSSDNKEEDEIYIINNAKSLKSKSQVNLNDVAIRINLNKLGFDWGKQINVLWGEDYNIAYVLSNNGTEKYYHKLLLGMGKNKLQYGVLKTVSDTEFNGTFNILNTFTTSYSTKSFEDISNQGSCYYKNKIVETIGHGSILVHKSTLNLDGTVQRKCYNSYLYNNEGVKQNITPEGNTIHNDLMYIGVMDNDKRYVNVYKL